MGKRKTHDWEFGVYDEVSMEDIMKEADENKKFNIRIKVNVEEKEDEPY
jgi:hypothetical protein